MIYVHEPQAMSSQTSKAQVRHTYKADIQGMHAHRAAGAEDHARVRHKAYPSGIHIGRQTYRACTQLLYDVSLRN